MIDKVKKKSRSKPHYGLQYTKSWLRSQKKKQTAESDMTGLF